MLKNKNLDIDKKMLNNNKMYDEFLNLLEECRVEKGGNFNSMGELKGVFHIPDDRLDEFYDKYDPKKHKELGIVEPLGKNNPIQLVLDCDYETETKETYFNESKIKSLIFKINNVIQKVLKVNKIDLTCVLLDKTPYKKGNKIKHGIHIQFPKITITKEILKNYIIPEIKDETIDSNVSNWFIYGNSKGNNYEPYKVKCCYDYKGNEVDLISSFNNPLYDLKNDNSAIYKLLSVKRPFSEVEKLNPEFKKKIKLEKQKKEIKHSINFNNTDKEKYDMVNELVLLLNEERATEYGSWRDVGFCIKNILGESGIDLFLLFSKKSKKYSESGCEKFWNNISMTDDLTMGSLRYWAKGDNPEGYKLFCKEHSKHTVKNNIMNISHMELAEVFNLNVGNDYYWTNSKNREFYYWNKNKLLWEKIVCAVLTFQISKSLSPIVKDVLLSYVNMLEDESVEDKLIVAKRIEKLEKVLSNLNSAPYLNNILRCFMGIKGLDEKFEEKLDVGEEYELPIKNGNIIDLRNGKIRKRNKSDLYTFYLEVNIKDNYNKSLITEYYSKLFLEKEENILYFQLLMGYCLTGSISERMLWILHGEGYNGKSEAMNKLNNILSDFCIRVDNSALLEKKSSGTASPELLQFKAGRVALLPETDKNDKLNSKNLKSITGNDTIKARALYGTLQEFKTRAKPLLPTNHKPIFDVKDRAMLDRVCLIPFHARFPNCKDSKDCNKNECVCGMIENQKWLKQFNNMDDDFFSYFVEGAIRWYSGESLSDMTEDMKVEIEEYVDEIDTFKDFVNLFQKISPLEYKNLDKNEKMEWRITRADIYKKYMDWTIENNIKPESRTSVYKYLRQDFQEYRTSKSRGFLLKEIKVEVEYENDMLRLM